MLVHQFPPARFLNSLGAHGLLTPIGQLTSRLFEEEMPYDAANDGQEHENKDTRHDNHPSFHKINFRTTAKSRRF